MASYYLKNLNKYSKVITQTVESGPAQAMLYSLGLSKNDLAKPQVGIGTVHYTSNPCNAKLDKLSSLVKKNIDKKGGLSFPFTSIGVSDGISMGTSGMKYSLPSRDLISWNYETICRAHHYDALVAIAGCDKNLPGVAQALFTLNRPGLIIYGGSMPPSNYQGKELDIVSAFEAHGQLMANEINEQEYEDIISNACHRKCGSCSGFYTANTMAAILEVMGLTLPNSSSNPSQSNAKKTETVDTAYYLNKLLLSDLKPLDIVTKESFMNAITMLYITGGSTNAIIHLLSMAKTAGISLTLDDFKSLKHLPVLLNMKPHGKYMMYHLHKTGGMSVLIKYLIENGLINGDVMTVTGGTLARNVNHINTYLTIDRNIIYPLEKPFKTSSHINILKGNLAPNGAITKISSEKNHFSGTAKVFDTESEMLESLQKGEISKDNFVILRYQGETVGCPEMLRPTSALSGYFGTGETPPLATDGRFSGGSHGILVAHLEDAYRPGSVTAIIKNGDLISINLEDGSIHLEVDATTISDRLIAHIPKHVQLDGFLKMYSKTVGTIETGFNGC